MPKQFLNCAEIRAFLQHVRAESVAQGVGMSIGGQSIGQRQALHDAADAPGGEAVVSVDAGAESCIEQQRGA